MAITIERVPSADSQTRADIIRPLSEDGTVDAFAYSPVFLGLALTDETGADGGFSAQLYWDWMVIENIGVPQRWRGRGFGTKLMERAEAIATEAGCKGAWVSTYSFQSPGFYLKMGYEIFGRLPSYPADQERLFLSKLFR